MAQFGENFRAGGDQVGGRLGSVYPRQVSMHLQMEKWKLFKSVKKIYLGAKQYSQ